MPLREIWFSRSTFSLCGGEDGRSRTKGPALSLRAFFHRHTSMKSAQSPLFEPVIWEGSGFKILNEIALPEKIQYIEIKEVTQALDAVREMRTRAFGQVLTFLYSGALLAQQYQRTEPNPLRQDLAKMTQQFSDARPTFDFKGLGEFFSNRFNQLPAAVNTGAWISAQARGFAGQILRARLARAN